MGIHVPIKKIVILSILIVSGLAFLHTSNSNNDPLYQKKIQNRIANAGPRQQIITLQKEIAALEKRGATIPSGTKLVTKQYSAQNPKTTADEIAELTRRRDTLASTLNP